MEARGLRLNTTFDTEFLDSHAIVEQTNMYPGLVNTVNLYAEKDRGRVKQNNPRFITFSNQAWAWHTESMPNAFMESILTDESISLLRRINDDMPRWFLVVRQQPSGRYVAEIQNSTNVRLRLWLGTFDTAQEAALACDEVNCALRWTRARDNFRCVLTLVERQLLSKPSSKTKHNPAATIVFSSSHQQHGPTRIIPRMPVHSDYVYLVCPSFDEMGNFFTTDTNSGRLDSTFSDRLRPPRSATNCRVAETFRMLDGIDDGRSILYHQLRRGLFNRPRDFGTDFHYSRTSSATLADIHASIFSGCVESLSDIFHDQLEYHQLFEENTVPLSRNHGNDFGKSSNSGHDEMIIDYVIMDCGKASTRDHGSNAPEVCIDIWNESDDADHITRQITYQAWKEHIDQLKKSRFDNYSMMMMIETTLALGGQALGAVMANALTRSTSSSSSSSSWAVYLVELAIVLGLSFTLAGIGLLGKRRALSILTTKIGAIATASAIIISLGSHLPPVMAWTVGPFAFLVIAVAVALA